MLKSIILVCLFSLALPTSGQEAKDPILVDEFETLGCCHFRGRIDVFFSELANNPNDVGVIVTAGPLDKQVAKVVREEAIRTHEMFRNFDPGRLRYIRTDGRTLQTRLLRLPFGSETTKLPSPDSGYTMKLDEPAQILVDYPYEFDGLCPEIESRQIFALFLVANSTSSAKIVLRGYSTRDATRLERELLKQFVSDEAVDPRRIKFSRGPMLESERASGPAIEFWLLP